LLLVLLLREVLDPLPWDEPRHQLRLLLLALHRRMPPVAILGVSEVLIERITRWAVTLTWGAELPGVSTRDAEVDGLVL
jgi:hypothetical protein